MSIDLASGKCQRPTWVIRTCNGKILKFVLHEHKIFCQHQPFRAFNTDVADTCVSSLSIDCQVVNPAGSKLHISKAYKF